MKLHLLTVLQSASPSSIVTPGPALLTPVSSTGYATEGSSAGLAYPGDHHRTNSPQSISGSASSYNTIPARVLSPHNQKPMVQNLNNGPPDLRVAVPHEPTSHWQGAPQHMQPQYQQQQQQRSSWDMGGYMEHHSPAGGPPSGSSVATGYQPSRDAPVANDGRRLDGSQQMPRS